MKMDKQWDAPLKKEMNKQKTTPKYEHDCKRCTFLGREFIEGKWMDLYHCMQGINLTLPTVIVRSGNSGEDYTSGMFWGRRAYESPEEFANMPTYLGLGKAYELAMEKGLSIKE